MSSLLELVCSLFCSKGTQDSWSVPRDNTGHNGVHKEAASRPRVESGPQVVTDCFIHPQDYDLVHGRGKVFYLIKDVQVFAAV